MQGKVKEKEVHRWKDVFSKSKMYFCTKIPYKTNKLTLKFLGWVYFVIIMIYIQTF